MSAGGVDTAREQRPYTLVAELTYRCPLRCAYCSNPVEYAGERGELDTASWLRVFEEAEALGAVQLHLTGGEPLLRDDLETLLARAHELGLYTNLITSAVGLERERLVRLQAHGLDNIQISIQGLRERDAERSAGRAALGEKLAAARCARELGLPLTLNVVLHRENIDQLEGLVELAAELGVDRLELANTQYLGWALLNRSALLPSAEQIARARAAARRAQERYLGRMEILFVLPDYYSDRPRACMDGWARRYLLVNPDGRALPCHLAHTLPGLEFARVTESSLAEIWHRSPGFNAFRGEGWMPEPCKSCERRTIDFGGCRCQAYHVAGDAASTDPACALAPEHARVSAARHDEGGAGTGRELVTLHYRRVPRVAGARE